MNYVTIFIYINIVIISITIAYGILNFLKQLFIL